MSQKFVSAKLIAGTEPLILTIGHDAEPVHDGILKSLLGDLFNHVVFLSRHCPYMITKDLLYFNICAMAAISPGPPSDLRDFMRQSIQDTSP